MPQKVVAYDSGHLLERGTDVALYDYAHFNETILKNRSVILCPAKANISCIDRFRTRFPIVLYQDRWDHERALQDVDLYYKIVYGQCPEEPDVRPPNGRLAIHCVFRADQPYGDIYATVSPWVACHYGDGCVPVVPHILHLPNENGHFRNKLQIPLDATVIGRHGGAETFNIPFVKEAVVKSVHQRSDLYYLFLNTIPFFKHPRIIYLDKTFDLVLKTRFINTCDAMLHGRREGETFGLSVGEFSIRNKPVITWLGSHDKFHIEVLGGRGIYYKKPEDLMDILLNFRPMPGNWDAYSEHYSPEPVMRIFAEVFLGEQRLPSYQTSSRKQA